MPRSCLRFIFAILISMVAAAAVAEGPGQIDADRARGQQVGYNACRTVCRPTVPVGNQASAGFVSGWITGCNLAGGPAAACQQGNQQGPGTGNPQPPVNTTPVNPTGKDLYTSGDMDGYIGCMSSANLNRTITVPEEFFNHVPYVNGYYDGCVRALAEWAKKNATKPLPVMHLPAEGKTSQANYERGRQESELSCADGKKPDYEVRTEISGPDFARGFQDGCAAKPLTQLAASLYADAGNSGDRANGLMIAAHERASSASSQKVQSYLQLSQVGKDLAAAGKRLRDEALNLSRAANPTQQQLASLQARVRDYVERVQAGEKNYYELNKASEPTPPPPTLESSNDEPPISAQEAVAFIRSHPELVPKAQEIVRSMQASGKSENQIELAIRQFAAVNRVTVDTRVQGRQNASNGSQTPPLSSGEINKMIAETPELKKQMQDYAAELRKQGKSNQDVLEAVYQRMNEIHAEQVRATSPIQTPQRFQSGDAGSDGGAPVGRFESGEIEKRQAGDVQRRNSQGIDRKQADSVATKTPDAIGRDRAQSVQGTKANGVQTYQADSVRGLRSQDVRRTQAQDVQLTQAQNVQQYRATEIQRDQAQDVRPYQAEDVRPNKAQDVQSRRAQDIQPYRADDTRPQARLEIGPEPRKDSKPRNDNSAGSAFMHTFGLAVPGVVYSYDNYAANTRTTVTATGTVTKSAVRISPDHTYQWNSAWDGR
ncbi:MAG TPA: hypothetical protein VN622_08515, partial [Clostridia bacterium]|nr:hypothetical protein [Clostridia bacterium]